MIIGVTGYKRSGKDTVADFIIGDYGFKKYSFAFPIKETVKICFGWTDEHVYGELKEVEDPYWGISPRLALQLFGTEFAQVMLPELCPGFKEKTGRTIWLRHFLKMVDDAGDSVNWVIPDVRFPHEVEGIKSKNGIIIRVIRDEVKPSGPLHDSERFIPELPHDYEIDNNSTRLKLYTRIHKLMDPLMADKGIK
jgi:hypothetical protein